MSKYLTPPNDEFLNLGNGHCDFAWDKVDNECEFLFGVAPSREPKTLYEEYVDILKNVTGEIAIPMSGGIDSEVIAEACVREGIDFRPAMMRYMVDGGRRCLNVHDLQYAELFCEEHDIYPSYFDLDIEQFMGSEEFWQLAKLYYCISPQLVCHLWLLSKLTKNFAIIPGDFMYMANNSLTVNVFKYHTYDFYFDKTPVKGIAKILSHTPEIIASQIMLQKEQGGYSNNYDRKCKLYEAGGFKAKPRPHKYTGFEEVLKYYQLKYGGEHRYQIFNDRFRKPLEEKIQQPKQIHVWVNDGLQEYING